jgi:hypothetical protein
MYPQESKQKVVMPPASSVATPVAATPYRLQLCAVCTALSYKGIWSLLRTDSSEDSSKLINYEESNMIFFLRHNNPLVGQGPLINEDS